MQEKEYYVLQEYNGGEIRKYDAGVHAGKYKFAKDDEVSGFYNSVAEIVLEHLVKEKRAKVNTAVIADSKPKQGKKQTGSKARK